ncbi:cupin domain-containing protein [Paenibacillus sp. FSL A5-0031]|uniref:cupin domain-containing protein n=1 Tax=Paenibacillus sp. FSL A5-0031 TaxID=1920420 RepID=UPI0009F9188C|nr:cupin domain-containing protein [Paenibacillus sp. FSL A5-0031]
MTSYMDYTSPQTEFAYDLNNSTFFKKDPYNYINLLSVKQLNTLGNSSLLDIYLSKSNVVEPHYHQNASELVYCISGSAEIALMNPFTNEFLHYLVQPAQVVNIPQGWWHYEMATVDNTHLLAIFDAPIPEVIFGSDILRLTPTNILAYTYCLDQEKLENALAPLKDTVILGPPSNCSYNPVQGQSKNMQKPNQAPMQQQAPVQSNQVLQPNQTLPFNKAYQPNQGIQSNQAKPNQGYYNQMYGQQYYQHPY